MRESIVIGLFLGLLLVPIQAADITTLPLDRCYLVPVLFKTAIQDYLVLLPAESGVVEICYVGSEWSGCEILYPAAGKQLTTGPGSSGFVGGFATVRASMPLNGVVVKVDYGRGEVHRVADGFRDLSCDEVIAIRDANSP